MLCILILYLILFFVLYNQLILFILIIGQGKDEAHGIRKMRR